MKNDNSQLYLKSAAIVCKDIVRGISHGWEYVYNYRSHLLEFDQLREISTDKNAYDEDLVDDLSDIIYNEIKLYYNNFVKECISKLIERFNFVIDDEDFVNNTYEMIEKKSDDLLTLFSEFVLSSDVDQLIKVEDMNTDSFIDKLEELINISNNKRKSKRNEICNVVVDTEPKDIKSSVDESLKNKKSEITKEENRNDVITSSVAVMSENPENKSNKLISLESFIKKQYPLLSQGMSKALRECSNKKVPFLEKSELEKYSVCLKYMENILNSKTHPSYKMLAPLFAIVAKHLLYIKLHSGNSIFGSPIVIDTLEILNEDSSPIIINYNDARDHFCSFAIDDGWLYGLNTSVRLILPIYDANNTACPYEYGIPYRSDSMKEFDELLFDRKLTNETINSISNYYIENMSDMLYNIDISLMARNSISKDNYMRLCKNMFRVLNECSYITITGSAADYKQLKLINYSDIYNFKLARVNGDVIDVSKKMTGKNKDSDIHINYYPASNSDISQ